MASNEKTFVEVMPAPVRGFPANLWENKRETCMAVVKSKMANFVLEHALNHGRDPVAVSCNLETETNCRVNTCVISGTVRITEIEDERDGKATKS